MRTVRKSREDGASLVEFALIAPLLVLLLFGIIEFAWVFAQNLDVRHGAREGARLAAVNHPVGPLSSQPASRDAAQTAALVAEICGRMDLAADATVSLASAGGVGDPATATVTAPIDTLTGFLDWALPSGTPLSSSVEIRMEQYAGWADTTSVTEICPP
ncbi:MAG: TadE/TadG family type IV pilus assembly protein [Acidimicrobiia bacterium]